MKRIITAILLAMALGGIALDAVDAAQPTRCNTKCYKNGNGHGQTCTTDCY